MCKGEFACWMSEWNNAYFCGHFWFLFFFFLLGILFYFFLFFFFYL